MWDVLVVGAGPAGAVAATVAARAGARVKLIDRAEFPRAKLCGDTVNPGTLALLRRLRLASALEDRGLPVVGFRLTGGNGVAVDGRYPRGLTGRAIARRDLDWSLLIGAVEAGAVFDSARGARRALVEEQEGRRSVSGVIAAPPGRRADPSRARVTIVADGRHSRIAFGLGLARHPAAPRRWAVGAYYADVDGLSDFGEMHVRKDRYIGVARLPGGVTNVCLVRESGGGDRAFADPAAALARDIGRDPLLGDRFSRARLASAPVVLGPLAVDAREAAIDGLLVAGDAGGFIDPMTGDGLRFAIRGGELAATAALEALEHGWSGVHARLTERRRREFDAKW